MVRTLIFALLAVLHATASHAVGGETMETAAPIPGMPYTDTGGTCGHVNDYVGPCGEPSASPDVVYSFTPSQEMWIKVNACDATSDNQVYVYAGSADSVAACDSWSCLIEGQSVIEQVRLSPGTTYYIVVDGDHDECGWYSLQLSQVFPCLVDCVDGAQPEDEPPCQDGYVDSFNGGCNGSGWTLLQPTGGCADFCGRSCTYTQDGQAVTDHDWFDLWAVGGTLTASVVAEFPVRLVLVYALDCGIPEFEEATAEACTPATVSASFTPGQEAWLLVVPQDLTGVPESSYSLNVCGIGDPPVPTEAGSWGQIKARYRGERSARVVVAR